MTVKELKAKLPEADVMALSPGSKYLILVSRQNVSMHECHDLSDALRKEGIKGFIAVVHDTTEAIKVLELE